MTTSAHPHVPALTGGHAFPHGGWDTDSVTPRRPDSVVSDSDGAAHLATAGIQGLARGYRKIIAMD